MDPTLVLGTWFESQFQICVYEHAILRIYISFFFHQRLDAQQIFSTNEHGEYFNS